MRSNILLLLISLVVSCVLSEIILRVFVPQETKRLATFDEVLGWRGTPNGEGVYIRRKDNIAVPFRYNNAGFRDEDFPVNDSLPQIVFLGDSFVESLEVPYEDTFQKRIETELTEQCASPVAVINLSSQGYSTAQELLVYRKFREALHPDIVLLSFYTGNDFDDNLRSSFARLTRNGEAELVENRQSWGTVAFLKLQRWLYENSHFVFFLKNTAQSLLHTKLAPSSKDKVHATEEYANAITGELLRMLADEVNADGFCFGVVIIPSTAELEAGSTTKSDFVESVCREHQVPYVRLDSVLTASDYFQYDEHLNSEGHLVVTHEVLRFLGSPALLKGRTRVGNS